MYVPLLWASYHKITKYETTSGLSILMYSIISLPDESSFYKIL